MLLACRKRRLSGADWVGRTKWGGLIGGGLSGADWVGRTIAWDRKNRGCTCLGTCTVIKIRPSSKTKLAKQTPKFYNELSISSERVINLFYMYLITRKYMNMGTMVHESGGQFLKFFNTVWPRNDILIILFFDWITDTNRCEQILKEDEQTNLHDRLMLICIEIQSLKITPIDGNSESLLTFYVSRFRTSRYTNKEKELMSSYLSLSPINAPLHTPKDMFTPR